MCQDGPVNTPAHLMVNLAVLGAHRPPREQVTIVLAAVLPDVPMFGFYAVEKLLWHVPEARIWDDYFQANWQHLFDAAHSVPLMVIGFLAAYTYRSNVGMIFCLSLLLHVAGDLPLHHDDAHRHFFPLSDWRFESPVSYWDPRHFGQLMSGLEVLAVVSCGGWVLTTSTWMGSRIIAGLIVTCYAGFLAYAYTVWG